MWNVSKQFQFHEKKPRKVQEMKIYGVFKKVGTQSQCQNAHNTWVVYFLCLVC